MEVIKNIDVLSNSLSLKPEDFHDESSLAWIQASPVLDKSSKEEKKRLKKQQKKSSEQAPDDFSLLYSCVPQVKEHFVVQKLVGSGTFSNVYLATLKELGEDSQPYALKHIFSTSHPKRIENEVKCLHDIGGMHHVVGVQSCIRHNGEVVIIMPYIKHTKFMEILHVATLNDVRDYMRQLLIALNRVHSFDIIHRDVKPNNFLFDLDTKTGGLVDFGLAQECKVSKSSTKVEAEKHPEIGKQAIKPVIPNNSNLKRPSPNCKHTTRHSTGTCLSPRAKRKCLAEIRQNSIEPGVKAAVAKFALKKAQTKCLLGNEENLAHGGKVRKEQKAHFVSFTSPLPQLNHRNSASKKKKSSGVTIADVFPDIKKYGTKNRTNAQTQSSDKSKACNCYGKLTVCFKCLARPGFAASRAGTAGFRAPEVLFRYSSQTTAVDIWAAGVIFLSLLSGRCPFFRPAHDIDSLSQIVSLFGSKKVQETAKICGRRCTISTNLAGYDLKGIVMSLRKSPNAVLTSGNGQRKSPRRRRHGDGGVSPDSSQSEESDEGGFRAVDIPDSAFDLLEKLLDLNPNTRITAIQALNHRFLFRTDVLF